MIQHDDVHGRALLAFRGALRADPELRARYAALKGRLAMRHQGDRDAYTNAKSDVVGQVLRGAGIDPPVRDRLPEQGLIRRAVRCPR